MPSRCPAARWCRRARSRGRRASSRTPWWPSSGCRSTDGGRVAADRFCQVVGHPGVWAIGDAAGVPDPAHRDRPSPADGPARLRQGKVVGDNVAAALSGARPAAAVPLPHARRLRRHGPQEGRGQHARASSGAASRPGSSPAPTTSRSCRARPPRAAPDGLDRRAAVRARLRRAGPARPSAAAGAGRARAAAGRRRATRRRRRSGELTGRRADLHRLGARQAGTAGGSPKAAKRAPSRKATTAAIRSPRTSSTSSA